jgi:putative ABC transport system permease protein
MLMAAMAALLLAACANAGNQVLVYRLHRERDLQMRQALGAGRGLLAAQAVWEGLLLGIGGGALGLVLGAWAGDLLAAAFPVAVPGIEAIRFDLAAGAFTVAAAAISGALLGAPSALRLLSGRRRLDGGSGLQSPAAPGRRAATVRGALLVTEVALTLPLVAAAGLLAQSLLRLTEVDPGFQAAAILAVRPLLASVVFGIGPADPWTVGGACLLILVVGLAAAYVPARDAARVNAREALQGGG